MERLLEFALGVEGRSVSVNRKTSRRRRGFVVSLAFKLSSFEQSLHGFMKSKYQNLKLNLFLCSKTHQRGTLEEKERKINNFLLFCL